MWTVCALYRFVQINDLPGLQAEIKRLCETHSVCGTILLAPEGINGTIAAPSEEDMSVLVEFLDKHLGVRQGELKYSSASDKPFERLKVRLKREIITMRQPHIDPVNKVGTYVEPKDWNAIISDPEVLVLDTRNDYETQLGIFKNAVDPDIKIFTEFADYVKKELDPQKHKKIAMFCTGGIRCEKASSYMLAEGFPEVYHLKGGILKYLEEVPPEDSLWEGECFVFDKRVGLKHGLQEGEMDTCYGCRASLTEEDLQSPLYEAGVTCSACHATTDEKKKASRRMRHHHRMQKKKAA